MFLVKIVFAVFATSVTNHVFVSSQEDQDPTETTEEPTEPPPLENHTFVALIDILFVDGTRRRCTGTIIHDNAIITAAHCFLRHGKDYVAVEISGSFIVLGTKKMFDTGYENYLPIERIITHPEYKGWTADLALVFTFAGMTTDKPGNVIPLVEESESTPVDSNVTILSWGNCCENENKDATQWPGYKKRRCTSSEEDNDSCEPTDRTQLRGGSVNGDNVGEIGPPQRVRANNSQHRSFQVKPKEDSLTTVDLPTPESLNSDEEQTVQKSSLDNDRDESEMTKDSKESSEVIKSREVNKVNEPTQNKEVNVKVNGKKPALSIGSPYLMPVQEKNRKKDDSTKTSKNHQYENTRRNTSIVNTKDDDDDKEENWSEVLETVIQRSGRNKSIFGEYVTQRSLKSRRRLTKMKAPKENTLTVETFGFVNVQTCKKLIDKALPALYHINTNEVVCYAADEHYISDDDSGAPAVREGRLVAVTVGGAECEGDHVAIGMKMTCYCEWIVENLPPGETNLECCEDCCGEEKKDKKEKKQYKKTTVTIKEEAETQDPTLRFKAKHRMRSKLNTDVKAIHNNPVPLTHN